MLPKSQVLRLAPEFRLFSGQALSPSVALTALKGFQAFHTTFRGACQRYWLLKTLNSFWAVCPTSLWPSNQSAHVKGYVALNDFKLENRWKGCSWFLGPFMLLLNIILDWIRLKSICTNLVYNPLHQVWFCLYKLWQTTVSPSIRF